jgi:hypothetical protein
MEEVMFTLRTIDTNRFGDLESSSVANNLDELNLGYTMWAWGIPYKIGKSMIETVKLSKSASKYIMSGWFKPSKVIMVEWVEPFVF